MKVLREVLKHHETPLDVNIQCAQILDKEENAPAEEHKQVAYMPTALPGETTQKQMAVWRGLYDQQEGDDPEYTAACKRVLELAATTKRPECLPSTTV